MRSTSAQTTDIAPKPDVAQEKDWEKIARRASLARSIAWALLIPLSWYFGWISSVTFVAVCSLYANAASDFAAYRADSNARAERMEKMVEELLERVQELTDNDRTLARPDLT